MSIEHVFTVRMVVTLIAVGVLALVAFALIRSVVSRGMPVVWEILRITTNLFCLVLVGLSAHGNISPWGVWIGFGGVLAVLLIALYVSRSAKKTGRDSSPNS
jgi:divalent metal cation (Fe/Co/Zn/Cd) transporter